MGGRMVRVPQVMQMEAEECGAACLDMVCCFYRKWLPLEQVRLDCGVSRDEANALAMVKTARLYGLGPKAVSCNLQYLKEKAKLPAILHWEFNHFVVLAGFFRGKAVINDPAVGRRTVTMQQLSDSFTGICLEFSPDETFVPEGKKPSVWRFIGSRIAGIRRSLVFVMLATLLSSATAVVMPAFYRFYLDRILGKDKPGYLSPFLMALLLLIIFQVVASLLDEVAIRKFRGKLTILSNVKFMWHSLCLPLSFFSQRSSVDVAARQTENDEVSSTITTKLAPLLVNLVMICVYLYLMVSYSVPLALVALCATGVNLIAGKIASAGRIAYSNATMINQSKLRSTTVSGIDMIDTIKASGAENGFFNRWAGMRSLLTRTTVSFARRNAVTNAVPMLVHRLSELIVLALGSEMIINGQMTVGMLMAFQAFMNQFLAPAENLLADQQSLEEMATSVERIWDVMDYPEDPLLEERKVQEGEELTPLEGNIDVKGLQFGYSRMLPPVIPLLDLSIKKGQTIALVGPTGSGKSTLAKLILGLYQPWSGDIRFDGKLRREYPREVMTSSIAVIDQDCKMFEGTLMENLKLWDDTIEDSTVIQACRDAMIHGDIMLRQGGYSCRVAEDGRNFSGGQLQRFEIARVLASSPSILLLDEATSALDADTEYQVMRNIKAHGVTMLVISHRLSAIRDSDEIIVLDHGQIVERGRHEELFKAGGLYSHLVTVE